MDKIYLDSCLVIYLVERHPRFYGPVPPAGKTALDRSV
jgi:hypothetical protein